MALKAVAEALGGKQNGSPTSFNFDVVTLVRNVAFLLGIAVVCSLWVSKLVNAPTQIENLENRMTKIENSTIRTDEGIKNINDKITALSTAVNTLIVRTYDKH